MKRIFAVISACAVLFCFAACAPPEQTPDGFLLDGGYAVVYDEDSPAMYEAAKSVQTAIREAYGATALLRPDSVAKSGKEIVLGNTSRGDLSEGLRLRDFEVRVSQSGDITIGGGEESAVVAGAADFIGKYLGEKHAFTAEDSYIYRYDYEYDSVTVNGSDLLSFTVVYGGEAAQAVASRLLARVADGLGEELTACAEEDSDGGREIRIGIGDEEGNPVFSDSDYALYMNGEDLVLNATERGLASTNAGDALLSLFSAEAENGALAVEVGTAFSITEGEQYSMEFVSAERTAVVREGVHLYEFHYKNAGGDPVIVYAAEIKANSGCTLAAATVNDGYEVGNNLSQTVLGMAEAAQANGKNVMCAVNSGFFALSGNKQPEGVVVKDGQVLYQGSGVYTREWWGLTKSGEIVFGEYYDLYIDNDPKKGFRDDLQQATAGNHLLWLEGEEVEIVDSDTFLLGANPRSCFLVRENGDIVIFVADGRYEGSAGLTMEEEQEIARRMGAYSALNLDGGGSSQLVLPTGENGALEVVNRPLGAASDSSGHRMVADGILVLFLG